MKVVETIAEMKLIRRDINGTVGFAPTMGYLHEGHLSLVRRAKAENRVAVVSIFVNPTQFGPDEDFARYPRDTERDLRLLVEAGTDYVFMPGADEMYPPEFNTWVDVAKVTERLEGTVRPGHFRGVATVVNKLFNIVRPDKAYFGQKDAQQCVVIKKMVKDLDMPLEIVISSTVREPDGLAMSSRNIYLSAEMRSQAIVLNRSLRLAEELRRQGEKNAREIKKQMADLIRRQPLANIDYISIADMETLEELEMIDKSALVSMVVKFGRTRLLDNTVLE